MLSSGCSFAWTGAVPRAVDGLSWFTHPTLDRTKQAHRSSQLAGKLVKPASWQAPAPSRRQSVTVAVNGTGKDDMALPKEVNMLRRSLKSLSTSSAAVLQLNVLAGLSDAIYTNQDQCLYKCIRRL